MITLTFKDIAAPVTDDERAKVNQIINNFFQKGYTMNLDERSIFVLATVYKESQDTIFEIAKGGV